MNADRPGEQAVPRKAGDWDCPNAACAEMNFGSRVACRKCAAPRPEGVAPVQAHVRRKAGDWDCPNTTCAEMNFGSRSACRKCAAPRPDVKVPRKAGDWDCPSAACGEMNFGSRSACRKCAAPKPEGVGVTQASAPVGRRRGGRGGGGVAVALHTGNGTHLTMVYVQSAPRQFVPTDGDDREARRFAKQEALTEAARWANAYWTQLQHQVDAGSTTPGLLRLEVGPMWGSNSIHVIGALAQAKAAMVAHFDAQGWVVDTAAWGTTAHINLKGSPPSILNTHVDIFNGWVLI